MLLVIAALISLISAELAAIILILHRSEKSFEARGISSAPLSKRVETTAKKSTFQVSTKPGNELAPFALSDEEIWAAEVEK